jgi:hypothetical protein
MGHLYVHHAHRLLQEQLKVNSRTLMSPNEVTEGLYGAPAFARVLNEHFEATNQMLEEGNIVFVIGQTPNEGVTWPIYRFSWGEIEV